MFRKKRAYQLWFAGGVSLWCLATSNLSQAQVTSDETLSTHVTTSDHLNFTITGGSRAGGNLFHSFREFSVPMGGAAFFDHPLDVQNIISRVTGGSISDINGLIRAHGSANLFLINPNGIIFGPNAQLKIGGSFLASTANRFNFADGTFFSATDLQAKPLLTISVPIGLQFGKTVGSIVNRSTVEDSSGSPVGLQVEQGKTLALVGGNIFLDAGGLFAPGGTVELGSVAGTSLVSLNPIAVGWTLGYESVQNFQDIQLSSQALITTGGKSFGDIQLRGRRIMLTGGSQVGEVNAGANSGGTLAVKASEFVEVSGGSILETGALSTGAAGDITLETRQLIVHDKSSAIDTSSDDGGRGGNLTVDVSESVEVSGGGVLYTGANGGGDAGKLKVTTGSLILRDGGKILSFTQSTGNGGTVIVNASDSVELAGTDASGNPSLLSADTRGSGNAGDITITTGRLLVQNSAKVSATSTGASDSSGKITTPVTGAAGELTVTARSIHLDNGGFLRAETMAGQGNINLSSQDLVLRRGSQVTADANGTATGGNITIKTGVLTALENSDIKANAPESFGGRVIINSQGIFGTKFRQQPTPESDITATSTLGQKFSGTVQINTLGINPSRGLVNLPVKPVDVTGLIDQGCPVDVGPRASKFVVTGRGGLPPNPREALRSEPALVDLGTTVQGQQNHASATDPSNPTNSEPAPLVEATGWVTNALGEVVLVATVPTVAPDIPWLRTTSCHLQ